MGANLTMDDARQNGLDARAYQPKVLVSEEAERFFFSSNEEKQARDACQWYDKATRWLVFDKHRFHRCRTTLIGVVRHHLSQKWDVEDRNGFFGYGQPTDCAGFAHISTLVDLLRNIYHGKIS